MLGYLHAVIVEGRLCSFPWPAAAAIVDATAGAFANAAGILEASPGQPVFFEVVDLAARRKRQAQTASTQAIKKMAFPVSVQRYSVCAPTPGSSMACALMVARRPGACFGSPPGLCCGPVSGAGSAPPLTLKGASSFGARRWPGGPRVACGLGQRLRSFSLTS